MSKMTKIQIKNKAVLNAWGSVTTGTYLGFNLKHMIQLANDKNHDLYASLLEVDKEVEMDGRIMKMHELYDFLSEE